MERAATTGIAVQETGFLAIQGTAVKDYHQNTIRADKANSQHLHFVDYPPNLAAGYFCLCILTPNANLPGGKLQPGLCQLSGAPIGLRDLTARN